MGKSKAKRNLTWVELSLFAAMALYLWFAWQGFSKMRVDPPMTWRWFADLIGGLSSVLMISASIYGLIRYKKKFLKSSK